MKYRFALPKSAALLSRVALCVLALSLAPAATHAAVISTNLIVNGDAEAGPGGTGGAVATIPGYTTTGAFTVTQYAAGGGFPNATDPGPAVRGLNFFSGGVSEFSSASQLVDISAEAAAIDLGSVQFDLSAFLGGFSSQNDNAALVINFLDGFNAVISSASIGPVSNIDRSDLTSLLFRQLIGLVPASTRFIDIDLNLTRTAGSFNDGYADNLSLVLSVNDVPPNGVPLPAPLALLGMGCLFFAFRLRRATH